MTPGFAADASAKLLPEGPGKDAVARVCSECHATDNIRKLRLSRDEWSDKIGDMVDRGAEGTEAELSAVLDYLTRNFGPDSKILVNTAPLTELKSILKLSNEEAQAVIDYRNQNGNFTHWTGLLKVPGIDGKKLEAKKDLMAF
jgi:competence protein ComEA